MNTNGEILIDARDVRKAFGDHQVLKGVSIQVRNGSSEVILGRSGIGKSVLLKSIVGLLIPDSGSIVVMGRDLSTVSSKGLNEIRQNIGYVFQYAALYDSLTVRENLEFPLRRIAHIGEDEINERVVEQLRLVGLESAIDKMPSELSGGMKKRIGLARAIISRPDIVLYDEPTAGLDPITAREISELILNLEQQFGISSITVTHDLECARVVADKIYILDDGTFPVTGTFDELKHRGDPLTKAFFQAVS
jgi:phospholipid/cholesterol/gamma-HCH transport system ATP-binding protein